MAAGGHEADGTSAYTAASWTKVKPAPRQETDFLQGAGGSLRLLEGETQTSRPRPWGRHPGPPTHRQGQRGSWRELDLGGPHVYHEPRCDSLADDPNGPSPRRLLTLPGWPAVGFIPWLLVGPPRHKPSCVMSLFCPPLGKDPQRPKCFFFSFHIISNSREKKCKKNHSRRTLKDPLPRTAGFAAACSPPVCASISTSSAQVAPDLGRSDLRFVTLTTAGQVDAVGSSCAPSGRVSVLPWAGGVRRDGPRDPGTGSRLGVRRLSPTCAPRRPA